MKGVSNKTSAREIELLLPLGWEFRGHDGGTHLLLEHPEFGQLRMSLSPSDRNWVGQHRRKVARYMGIDRSTLEARMGVERSGSGRSKFKVADEETRKSDLVRAAERAAQETTERTPTLSAAEVEEQVRGELREAEIAANLAIPGGLKYRQLISKCAQLRNELVQMVSDREQAA